MLYSYSAKEAVSLEHVCEGHSHLTFQCVRVGTSVTLGKTSRSQLPSRYLALSPVVRRLRRWLKATIPGIPKRLPPESRLSAPPAVLARTGQNALVRFCGMNSLLGLKTAGIYIGRDCRRCCALGDDGVEAWCLSPEVLRGDIWFEEG